MNVDSFRQFNSTYYVNRRRKEATIQPLQRLLEDNIEPQLDFIYAQLQRIGHITQEIVAVPEDTRAIPTLESISVQTLLEDQQQNLQEIKAQVERAIEIVLVDTEDIDPTDSRWSIFAAIDEHKGNKLIEKPTVYLPLNFYRTHDFDRKPKTIPENPSEYLPSDEEYFQESGCLDPPEYLIPSHNSYLTSRKKRSYTTSDADNTTNKFFCFLEPPPPIGEGNLNLPHAGDTYLRDGSPFYKKLDIDDDIYLPIRRIYGRVVSWVNGKVVYKPKFYYSNFTSTYREDDHWIAFPHDEENDIVKFSHFVIALPSLNPSRRLLAYVSPYTVSDSHFLGKKK